MLPWNLLKSSNSFTSYLSAYSVFLSSIAGVMVRFHRSRVAQSCSSIRQITDYYVIHKGHYNVKSLYHTDRSGWYWYTFGINFRCVSHPHPLSLLDSRHHSAYAAYISGIIINVVGFAGATGRDVPLAATRIYQMSFFTGFGVSALIYWTLNKLFPVRGTAECAQFEEVDMSADAMSAIGEERRDEDLDTKSIASTGVRSVKSKA